jgi:predicted DNA-binding protein
MQTPVFTLRLPTKDRKALERLAARDGRPLASLVRKILADWVREQREKQP